MPEVQMAGTKISIPVIGFGCSSLASVGRKIAIRLLESAFDVGIRHFDVARYYGYGETGGVLGTFIKSRRAQVTVMTKFGIGYAQSSVSTRGQAASQNVTMYHHLPSRS